MRMPTVPVLVIGFWAVAGLAALTVALARTVGAGWPGATTIWLAVALTVLMALSWMWPIIIHVEGESGPLNFNEGFLVLFLLLVPPAMAVLIFGVVSISALAVRERSRSPLKSVFIYGQVVSSAGVGALVFVALGGSADALGYAQVGASLAAAACAFAFAALASISIVAMLGMPWRGVVFGGLRGKLLITVGGISVAIPAGLLLAEHPAYLPLALLPAVILRVVGAGQFAARRDRARLRGLFEATLDVNRAMGTDATRAAVLATTGTLLRAPDVSLGLTEPAPGELAAAMEVGEDTLWLRASGRRSFDPFDEADKTLLDAMASVGSIALANTRLYAEVQQQKDRLSIITSSLGEGVCAVRETGEITFMNPAGAAMLGWSAEGTGADGTPIVPEDGTLGFLLDPAMRAIALRRTVTSYDTRFDRPDGTHFPVTMTASPVVGDEAPSGAVIVFRDTSERKAFEEQLARQAFQDALTGLANRRLLLDHLDHALLQADRNGSQVGVLFCDIDRFKVVNDNLGHQVGDELLRVIGERLRRAVRPGDTLSRFGGDEFVILLEGVHSAEDAQEVAERVLGALRDPIILSAGHEVVATMSIGIALSGYGTSRDDLLHDADVAMYRAKDRGRGGQFALFDVDRMGGRSAGRLDLDTALHHVVERSEVEVHYQPLVALDDRRIVGAEALVRWNHPEHGMLFPNEFIQLAEDNGTILPIGRAVLEQACRQARIWQERFGIDLQMGVNLSARQFQEASLADDIAGVLRSTGIEPSQLCLEITESLAMDDVEVTTEILTRLHGLGVRLAIDDFGTGHSSLGYLARFPIDVVKIDQSFVRDIDRDPVKSAIVSAVVALSRAIESTTVVEGVETAAQLEELKDLGCDVAQGFYFARPVPAAGFERLLASMVSPGPPDLRVVRGTARAG